MYCKHCGKEIKDGVRYCPACGKPTGAEEKMAGQESSSNKKKPNPRFLVGGLLAVVLIVGGVTIGKKLLSSDSDPAVASGEITEPDSDSESYDSTQNNPEDKKWAKKRSYKKAYEEEYDSFEQMVQEYSEESGREYLETVDEYADQIDEIYKAVEKEIPGLSESIAKDISSVTESETAATIIEEVAGAAINNENVRKTAYKATMIAADSLLTYMLNYTTTDYPFGFEVYAVNGDYALLRSNGTYDDFYKVTKRSMSYDTKLEAVQSRIDDLESESSNAGDEDEYAALMGRIAANRKREEEVKELFLKCMTSIACAGNRYCVDNASPKLFFVVDKDGSICNSFWATGNIGGMSDDCDLSLGSDGSCFIDSPSERFIIDRNGEMVFEGNPYSERTEEPEGESVVCTYGTNGNVLRETKMKDSTYGTYYVLELVDKKGKAEEILKMKDFRKSERGGRYFYPVSGFYYSPVQKFMWNNDSMACSDYTRIEYTSLENQEEDVVVDLSSGELYTVEEFEEVFLEEYSEKLEKNISSCEKGMPQDGWTWSAESGQVYTDVDPLSLKSGSSSGRLELDSDGVEFNMDTLLEEIGETREISRWYCKDDLLWVVTESGYFYTYDFEKEKKSSEVETGENAPCYFTPYGLLVYTENKEADSEDTQQNSSGAESEYSVYQYDVSGEIVAQYPIYNDNVSSLTDYVHDFLFSNGRDTYSLADYKVISM